MRTFLLSAALCSLAGIACAQAPAAPSGAPPKFTLSGGRFKPLTWDEMTPAQKTMIEHLLAGDRKGVGGPFNVLLRSPEMGDMAQQFGASMRFHSSIPRPLNELAIIITARFWTAQYEWQAHRRTAAQAGVSEDVIRAIAEGKRPENLSADQLIVYNFCTEALRTHEVSDATFAATKNRFGEKGVVDLIGVMGWYQMVSMTLNVDHYPLPAGVQPELKPLP